MQVNTWFSALILSAWTKSWPVQTRLYGMPLPLSGAFFADILANVNINELNSLETMSNPLGLDEILRVLDEMLACADKASWNAIAMQM